MDMTTTTTLGDPVDLPLPRPHPSKQHFDGDACTLTRTTLADADALFDVLSVDPGGWDFLLGTVPQDVRDFRAWIVKVALDRDPLFYTVRVDGRPLGILSLLRHDPANGVIEVGHVHFSKAMRGTRAATEAQFLLMSYVFDDLRYRRYEWKCNALNDRSRGAALRLGFTFEGVFRQHVVAKGRNRDTAWFSMLDREWPQVKARMQAWLAPENFDPDGQQITPLRAPTS